MNAASVVPHAYVEAMRMHCVEAAASVFSGCQSPALGFDALPRRPVVGAAQICHSSAHHAQEPTSTMDEYEYLRH
jgi:hypothetical protein